MIFRLLKNSSIFLITILILFLGCKPAKDISPESKIGQSPEGLVFIKTVEGVILGQKISEPFGLTSDMSGNVYLVDEGNNRLIRFNRDFQPLRDAGGFGDDEGLFNMPTYISIDNNLNLYVADGGNNRIAVFDNRLNFAKNIELFDPADPVKFGRPSGLKANQYGELWVADRDKSKIWIFNNIGLFDRSIGGIESTGGFLMNPAGMTTDRQGRTLVCDKGNGLIKIYDSFGIFLDEFGKKYLENPTGISIDSKGNIWVLDSKRPGIFCFDSSGDLIFQPEFLDYPGKYDLKNLADLTISPDNKLIISDNGNDRLLIFQILYP